MSWKKIEKKNIQIENLKKRWKRKGEIKVQIEIGKSKWSVRKKSNS
jgi:hypothetical protein